MLARAAGSLLLIGEATMAVVVRVRDEFRTSGGYSPDLTRNGKLAVMIKDGGEQIPRGSHHDTRARLERPHAS
jgi:hypothetical protein